MNLHPNEIPVNKRIREEDGLPLLLDAGAAVVDGPLVTTLVNRCAVVPLTAIWCLGSVGRSIAENRDKG